jgi:hypothetical protein
MPTVQGQVTQSLNQPLSQFASGNPATLSLGKSGELLASEFQGRYYSLCYAGKVFYSATQALVTLSSLSGTYTGLLVTNPYGTGVNLAMLQCAIALGSAPGGISTIHHEGAFPPLSRTAVTQGTPSTVYNSLIGNAAIGAGLAATAATIAIAPVAIRQVGLGVNATGSATTFGYSVDDIAGSLILQPGTFLGLGYLTTAVNVMASYHWAEIPQ